MSYPTYWKAIMTKLQDFKWSISRAKDKRKPISIVITFQHKRFTDNCETVILELKTEEMEALVQNIEQTIRLKEMELLSNIEKYERESRRKGIDTVGELDSK